MNDKAKDLERKAKLLRRKQKIKKARAVKKTVIPEKVLTKFIIHAKARRAIVREDKSLVDAIKWALTMIPKEELYEVHSDKDELLWGRSTGLNKEVFEKVNAEH